MADQKQLNQKEKQNLSVQRDFQAFYRANCNYKLLRQLKREHYECIRVHCYPLAEPRHIPFSLKRAKYCEKECSRPMEAAQGHQSAAFSQILQRLASECSGEEASAIDQACKLAIFTDVQRKLDQSFKEELERSIQ